MAGWDDFPWSNRSISVLGVFEDSMKGAQYYVELDHLSHLIELFRLMFLYKTYHHEELSTIDSAY